MERRRNGSGARRGNLIEYLLLLCRELLAAEFSISLGIAHLITGCALRLRFRAIALTLRAGLHSQPLI